MANPKVRDAVKLALAVNAGVAAIAVAPLAVAQDEGATPLEDVVVTGTRIKKKDFTSNAPVATIESEQLTLTGTVNTESLLNTLPQTVPGLDRTSNNPGNGTATVNLRGLGSNRTLVLVNGTRIVPTTSGGSVDLNQIPNALIEDIEVLTGGASAVYGSDAVAGVLNIIFKDDFEGITASAGYETTGDGDASFLTGDITLGANVADGRGNVTINLAVTDRDDLFQGDRDFAFFALNEGEDSAGNLILEPGGSSGTPDTTTFGFSSSTGIGNHIFDNGPTGATIRPFIGNQDEYNYAPVNYIQLPQTRYQATGLGKFEISDNAEVYGRTMFTSSRVPSQLAPTPIFQFTEYTLDGNPFIDPVAQQTISDNWGSGTDSDGDGIDDTAVPFIGRRLREVGPRISDDVFDTFQVLAGIRGDITDTWEYDVYASKGSVVNTSIQEGNVNRDRFDQALRLANEHGSAANPTGALPVDATACSDPSASGGAVGCTPMNIFGEGNISQGAADFIRTSVAAKAEYEQVVVSANVTGDLGNFELPGGKIGAAFGFEHREDDFKFQPSQDLAAGTIAGFNGAPGVSGGFDVDSFYGELYLPILQGEKMAELLDVELAYRSSDYSTSGSTDAFKIAASYAPNDIVRFRAGFNTAVRAPNVGELFSPRGENFPSAVDPCSAQGMPDATTSAACVASGVPSAAVGTSNLNLASSQVKALVGGNSGLKEEEAETLTAGVVVSPMDGLTISLDYFDIVIEDYVAAFGGSAANVLDTCYNTDGGDPASDFCSVINRFSGGRIDFIELTAQNVAEQTLKGYDLLGTYDTSLWDGDFRVNYVGTFTTESEFLAFATDNPADCAGKFGNLDCGEPLPEYKHRMTFNWSREDVTAQLSWRYVGEVDDDDPDQTYFVEKIDAESYFDGAVTYSFADNYAVTFGIDNLFDTEPPILGDNQEQANTWPATYDVFGRTFFLKATSTF